MKQNQMQDKKNLPLTLNEQSEISTCVKAEAKYFSFFEKKQTYTHEWFLSPLKVIYKSYLKKR